jgi:uncharacterized repeat protein (TIGR01451 family)
LGLCQGGEATWIFAEFFSGIFVDNSSVDLVYTVVVSQPLPDQSTITNAALSYHVKAISPTTFTDSGLTTVDTTVNAPTWSITKTAASSAEPGDYITYTITAQNTGNFTTGGIYTITDEIPANTSYFTSTPVATVSGSSLTWELSNSLGVGQTQSVTYVVQITDTLANGTAIVNDSYVVTGGNVYTGAVGEAITTTISSTADLVITKTASPASTVDAGDLLTYTLTVTNQQPSAQGPADNRPAFWAAQPASFLKAAAWCNGR